MVKAFAENKLLNQVRSLQNEILSNYASDFSKHAPSQEVPRIDMVWQSILGQLSKENKKFVYGVLKKGGRAKEFELAIQWLVDAGLVYKITKVSKPELPLKFYEDLSAFKLYLCDCGLMGAMADTPAKEVLWVMRYLLNIKELLRNNMCCSSCLHPDCSISIITVPIPLVWKWIS